MTKALEGLTRTDFVACKLQTGDKSRPRSRSRHSCQVLGALARILRSVAHSLLDCRFKRNKKR
jgi:hypothetical protein